MMMMMMMMMMMLMLEATSYLETKLELHTRLESHEDPRRNGFEPKVWHPSEYCCMAREKEKFAPKVAQAHSVLFDANLEADFSCFQGEATASLSKSLGADLAKIRSCWSASA